MKVTEANQNFFPIPLIDRDDKLLKITAENFEISSTAPDLKAMFVSELSERDRSKICSCLSLRSDSKQPTIKILICKTGIKKRLIHPQIKGDKEFSDLDYSVYDQTKIEVF